MKHIKPLKKGFFLEKNLYLTIILATVAKVIRFEDFSFVDIVVHVDKKLYKNANEFIGLLYQRVKEFFETFEDYLSKNNMQNKDLEIAMPIEFDKNKKENIFSRIRKYI